MTAITIDTLVARYHLPPSALGARERLERALAPAFEEALPVALARRGIDPEAGEICLSEVLIPLRLRLGAGDGALVLAWSDAAAAAIAAAIAGGGDDRAVRFASRRQALADFAAALARGDLGRAWAWAQLGLCRPEAGGSAAVAADDLARALAREPEAIVPVLADVARLGALAALVRRIPPGGWTELAARALAAAGGGAAIPALAGGPGEPPDLPPELAPELLPRIARALERSTLAASVRSIAAIREQPELRGALAALALVEADPGLLRRPEAPSALVLAATGLTVARSAAASPAVASPVPGQAAGASRPEAPRSCEPAGATGAPRPSPRQGSAHFDDLFPGSGGGGGDAVDGDRRRASEPEGASPQDPARIARDSGWTDWGGLLFLLAPMDELGLPDEIAASLLLAGRPSRWCLHRLALALAPAAEDDPAALAFCGLPPGAPPPADGEPPPAPEETELFAALAGRIAAEVARRLGEREIAAVALLDRVCRRRAEIVADPGWFEVRLSLDDVATELRRARLDLDPGYLPFLGVVVRFVYG